MDELLDDHNKMHLEKKKDRANFHFILTLTVSSNVKQFEVCQEPSILRMLIKFYFYITSLGIIQFSNLILPIS